MYYFRNSVETMKIPITSLSTVGYLLCLFVFIWINDGLLSIGQASTSIYVLAWTFIGESLIAAIRNHDNETSMKRKWNRSRASEILKAVGFLIGVAAVYFVGIILFGAPFLDAHEETLMLAGLLTLLTVYPLLTYVGVENTIQLLFRMKYMRDKMVKVLLFNVKCALFGAWVGAVVIPLDWDMPWQKWPIPCFYGAYFAYMLSNVYMAFRTPVMSTLNQYPFFKYVVCFTQQLDIFM